MRNYSLNFSRASSGVVLQYYNFLRLGKAGYRHLIQGCLSQAQSIAHAFQMPILAPYFEVIGQSRVFPRRGFSLQGLLGQASPFTLTALAQALKDKGWMVPVYRLANAEQIEVIRIVVRAHVSRAFANALLNDLEAAVQQLGEQADDLTPGDVWEWPALHVASPSVSNLLVPMPEPCVTVASWEER